MPRPYFVHLNNGRTDPKNNYLKRGDSEVSMIKMASRWNSCSNRCGDGQEEENGEEEEEEGDDEGRN